MHGTTPPLWVATKTVVVTRPILVAGVIQHVWQDKIAVMIWPNSVLVGFSINCLSFCFGLQGLVWFGLVWFGLQSDH